MHPLLIPMALGAGAGALTNRNPLKGAAVGAALGGMTGGLGGLGGAAPAAGTGLQVGGAAMAGAPGMTAGTTGTGLLASGGAPGMSMAAGAGTQLSAAAPAASGITGLLNPQGMQAVGNVAGLAAQMGVFDDPQGPAAQSAGIPARQADFSGLLRSQGQANNMAGAQRLMQQQMARKQGRL